MSLSLLLIIFIGCSPKENTQKQETLTAENTSNLEKTKQVPEGKTVPEDKPNHKQQHANDQLKYEWFPNAENVTLDKKLALVRSWKNDAEQPSRKGELYSFSITETSMEEGERTIHYRVQFDPQGKLIKMYESGAGGHARHTYSYSFHNGQIIHTELYLCY